MHRQVLLNRSLPLPSGLRVRIRLPRGADRRGLVALHAALGLDSTELDASRLMRHDPRRRAALSAEAWTTEGMALVGFVAGDVGADGPDVLLAAGGEDQAALVDLLRRALAERTGGARSAAAPAAEAPGPA